MNRKRLFLGAGAALILSICVFGRSNTSYAHCDTMDGPVIKDARAALEKKDVIPVLKWVSKEHEPEIRSAFNTALGERSRNAAAKEKADMKFFETLIRIHRAGEGETFTGIKPAGAIGRIDAEADKALETGSADTLTAELAAHLSGEVKKRFDTALEKKKHMNDSVEAGREYVEAYVDYLHFIEGVHKAIAGESAARHDTE